MTIAERLDRVREQPFRFTAEEFMELAQHSPIADWPGKVELVDGRIVRMSPANMPHWRIQQAVNRDLGAAYAAAGVDWLVGTEATVRLGLRKVRLPDVAVFRDGGTNAGPFPVSWLFLAVEISDTTLRIDLGPKRRDYARAGVPHYWVVDPRARETHVMEAPVDGAYTRLATVPFGEPLAVPGTDTTIVVG